MNRKDEHLTEQYCSSNQSKLPVKSESDNSTWKQSGVSASSKSLQSSSSYDSKSLYDSGRTDSGFLSGANLLSSEQYLSEENSTPSSPIKSKEFDSGEVKGDPIMRLDSGVDVELDEKLSSLSLTDGSINNLSLSSNSKSKSETSFNITASYESKTYPPSSRSVQSSASATSSDSKSSLFYPWHIYFQQDEDGDTQLHIAILHCFIEVVYSLIKMAPDRKYLDIKNYSCQTPLHFAVLTGQHNTVRWLLTEGAAPDILDMHGNTALHLAVSSQDIACVNALISPISSDSQNTIVRSSAPVYINQYNYDGLTCLHLAVMVGNIEIVRRLLDYGADVNAKEYKSGLTPLHIAIEMGNETLCKFLLNYCQKTLDLEMQSYAGSTAYQLASRNHPRIAECLRQYGAEWYPLDDSDDSDFDDDDEDDEMFGQNQFNSFKMNGTNGMVNVSA